MENNNDDEYIAKLIEEELWLNEFQSSDSFYSPTDIEMQRRMQEVHNIADEIRRDYEMQLQKEHLEQEQIERAKREQEQLERRQMREEQDRIYREMVEQDRLAEIKRNEKPVPPPHFICPITHSIIENPLLDREHGINYERKALLEYLTHTGVNHLGEPINKSCLETNLILKTEIALWKRENPRWNS
jgi:U-box domain